MLNFWNGNKTYLLAFAGALASFAFAMEWIDLQAYMALGGLLGFGGATALRHGIHTEAAKVLAKVEKVETKVEATAQVAAHVANVQAGAHDGGRTELR